MARCASMLNDNAFAWLADRCTETYWFQATLFIKQNKLRKLATSAPPKATRSQTSFSWRCSPVLYRC